MEPYYTLRQIPHNFSPYHPNSQKVLKILKVDFVECPKSPSPGPICIRRGHIADPPPPVLIG